MDDDILAVQTAFPMIYIACHVEHRTKRSSDGLTSRHSSILAHIGSGGINPSELAQHLGVRRSTVSETIKRLKELGLVKLQPHGSDGRRKKISLTAKGRSAISNSSVLDEKRLKLLLSTMDSIDRKKAVLGLEMLARAAGDLMEGKTE
jgi:DNA-binding MarR family transcriptional regulator